jgi:hypothetical protein
MGEPSGGDEIINGGVLSADAVPPAQTIQVDPSLESNVRQDLSTRVLFETHPAAVTQTTSSSNRTSPFLLSTSQY